MLTGLLLMLAATAAAQDPTEHFETRVRPLLVKKCNACHSAAPQAGLRLDSREALLKGGKSGAAIVPGDPDNSLLMAVLATPDADARVVEALPWLLTAFPDRFHFGAMVRQAKLQNLQNRLGFMLQLAAVDTPGALAAVRDLERARLLQEDTLCWESMPTATRDWMRANRTPLAAHWNLLTRLRPEDLHHAA